MFKLNKKLATHLYNKLKNDDKFVLNYTTQNNHSFVEAYTLEQKEFFIFFFKNGVEKAITARYNEDIDAIFNKEIFDFLCTDDFLQVDYETALNFVAKEDEDFDLMENSIKEWSIHDIDLSSYSLDVEDIDNLDSEENITLITQSKNKLRFALISNDFYAISFDKETLLKQYNEITKNLEEEIISLIS